MTAVCLFLLACLPAVDLTQPPVATMPVVISWYDPALCEVGESINCDSDPGHMASMTPVTEDLYNVTAACIPEWLGQWVTIIGYGRFRCLDTGGMIRPYYSEYHGEWVIPVDILSHEEVLCNFCTFREWEMQ